MHSNLRNSSIKERHDSWDLKRLPPGVMSEEHTPSHSLARRLTSSDRDKVPEASGQKGPGRQRRASPVHPWKWEEREPIYKLGREGSPTDKKDSLMNSQENKSEIALTRWKSNQNKSFKRVEDRAYRKQQGAITFVYSYISVDANVPEKWSIITKEQLLKPRKHTIRENLIINSLRMELKILTDTSETLESGVAAREWVREKWNIPEFSFGGAVGRVDKDNIRR